MPGSSTAALNVMMVRSCVSGCCAAARVGIPTSMSDRPIAIALKRVILSPPRLLTRADFSPVLQTRAWQGADIAVPTGWVASCVPLRAQPYSWHNSFPDRRATSRAMRAEQNARLVCASTWGISERNAERERCRRTNASFTFQNITATVLPVRPVE